MIKSNKVCHRKICDNRDAIWWNRITKEYYCTVCARRINESSTIGKVCELRINKNEKSS